MCGICGTVGVADRRLIEAMTATMVHRGPDGGGVELFEASGGRPPAAFGHRRLSIIDPTDRGRQPMAWGTERRYWITYNGELYNYRELRAELRAGGFSFVSDCDTEVLLGMYVRYGRGMLRRLNGIFAFAIWDAVRGELFLARDRLGVKPLYYARHGGVFCFGSEIKAMLPALGPPRVRASAVADYLTFLWVPDPDTLFEGVFKLPPAHMATFAGGALCVSEWWDLAFAPDGRGIGGWAPETQAGVGAAVRRQMVADVPVGAFLSGGLDSSAIVAEMARVRDAPVPVYTAGFSGSDRGYEFVSDDAAYAREMAREIGADHHERLLSADVVSLLPRLVWHMDEPIADPACITTFLLCSAARERLTVILSGMGGDEVFAGYPRHLATRLAGWLDALPLGARRRLRGLVEARVTMGGPGRWRGPRRNAMKLARGLDLAPSERFLTYCSYYTSAELGRLLGGDARAALGDHDPLRRHREYFGRVAGDDWVNQMLYVDMKTFLPCLNLAYTDRMSMAASTEVRVPLLDDDLVALSTRIPAGLKLRGTTRKYVLKKSMEGVLPKEIIWRPKAGFGAPVRSWLDRDLKEMVDDALSPARVRDRGWLDPAEVARLRRANAAGAEDNALRLWALLTLELWHQRFIDAAPAGAGAGAGRGAAAA